MFDLFDFGFVMLIIFIAVVAKIIWNIWFWVQVSTLIHQVVKAYNAQLEQQFRDAALAVQRHQEREARIAAQRAEEEIQRIPRHQRRRQREALSDIMNGRVVLNERTGELEHV
jgi:predicted Holliday junction resolvase-like endonuclease